MSVSFVVRLMSRLPAGQFIGEAIEVASGELVPIHDADELMTFITRFLAKPLEAGPLAEGEVSATSEDLQ